METKSINKLPAGTLDLLFLSHLNEAIAILDEEFEPVFVNDQMQQLLGHEDGFFRRALDAFYDSDPAHATSTSAFPKEIELVQGDSIVFLQIKRIEAADQQSVFFMVQRESTSKIRKQLETALAEKSFFRTILDNMPADIAVFDDQQKYRYLNHHAIKNDEIREWLIGKDDFDYVQRRNLPLSLAEARRARFNHFKASGLKQYSFEETIERNGEKTTNLRIMRAVRHPNGAFNFALGYGLNINQLKDYESKIKNQEIAIEVSTDGIAILNDKGEYTYLNEAHVKMYGFEKDEELLGKTWRELYHPQEIARIENSIFPEMALTGTWSGETTGFNQKTGKEIHTETSLTFLPDRGLVCICRDITERKLRDQNFRQLAVVAAKTGSMVIITDAAAKIEWVNEAFLQRTGFSFEEVVGCYPGDLMNGPETDAAVVSQIQDAVLRMVPFAGEKLSYMKDGTKVWFYLNATPIFNEKGDLTNWVSVETDITLLKDAEERIKISLEKERHLSQLKSRFVSMASHEFRTPLAGIMTSIDLVRILMERAKQSQDVRIEFHLERAMEEIGRMTEIMDNILLFGKMQSDRIPYNPVEQDFCEFVRTQTADFRLRYPEHQIRITCDESMLMVRFDEKLMGHLISNLLHNAIKYSPLDPNVTISIKGGESFYKVIITDNGIGIPEAEHEQLFTTFFRASNTENISGTGMGLVIVKQFVEIHNGTIEIQSKEGEGCRVILEFPCR